MATRASAITFLSAPGPRPMMMTSVSLHFILAFQLPRSSLQFGQNGILQIGYLWFNLIGAILVIATAFTWHGIIEIKRKKEPWPNISNS